MVGKSWLYIDDESPFSIDNIPFGIVSRREAPSAGTTAVAVGEYLITLNDHVEGGAFSMLSSIQSHHRVFAENTLNSFASLGRDVHEEVRHYIRELLLEDSKYPWLLKDNKALRATAIHPSSDYENMMPLKIGDYTDFYAGYHHAHNVGTLFRGPANALQPNYHHLPVGYHGRASTIRVSGAPVRRPYGQILLAPGVSEPVFSPSKKLDIELELAAFICKSNTPGTRIPIQDCEQYIFGYVLMNDWSARDIQVWEYVPLGPFNSKNFATSISPWVVLAGALESYRRPSLLRPQNKGVDLLPYLREHNLATQYDIRLFIDLRTAGSKNFVRISESNAAYLLYSFNQMLAHHTVSGCQMNVGDLLGSGTISGPARDSLGSLLEMTENGKHSLAVGAEGKSRMFLEDGDEVRITGFAGEMGAFVGFGNCQARIVAAHAP